MAKILIIDDEQDIVDLITFMLESENYEVLTASNGIKGLKKVGEEEPELVLLDYMMPDMDGLEVLKAIRKNYIDTYVVMVTGRGSETVAVEVMKAGASDYLIKPFDTNQLLQTVEIILKEREAEIHERRSLKKAMSMAGLAHTSTGCNEDVEYKGRRLHIQTENVSSEQCIARSQVFDKGAILASRTIDYSRFKGREDMAKLVNAIVKRLHNEMIEDLLIGKYDNEIEAHITKTMDNIQ